MAVGHLLLKSFWANEAVFQMMMLSYNLFLLFKFDSLHISEYRPQIKTFRLKYVFLAGKIIKTASGCDEALSKVSLQRCVWKLLMLEGSIKYCPSFGFSLLDEVSHSVPYPISSSQDLFVKFLPMRYRRCYNIGNISKILRRMKVNGDDFILRRFSGGISFQNTSPVEKFEDNLILTWNPGYSYLNDQDDPG